MTPRLRPYVVIPHGGGLLVFSRDQSRRAIEWVSLADGSSRTLIPPESQHLQGALTIDADRDGLLYVLSEQLRRLTILNERGVLQKVLPLRVPGAPISIRCLEGESFLIGTWKPGGLHVVDRNGDMEWSWSPGDSTLTEARSVAAASCGTYYVADAGLHRIIAVTRSGEIVRHFGSTASPGYGPGRFANPSMLEVDREGAVLVCDTRNHRVVRIEPDGVEAWEWPRRHGVTCRPTQLSMPWCARWLDDGGFVVADTYNFRVLHLDENGEILRSLGTSPVKRRHLSLPRSAQRVKAGRYLIADTYSNRVVEMDRRSRIHWQFGSGSSADLFWPRCTRRLADGRTVIADSRNNRILFVGGQGIERIVSEFKRGTERSSFKDPHDVLQTADGHLIVADTGNNRIVELDADGGWLLTFPSDAAADKEWRLSDPHNVSVDADDRLIVSDTGNDRILVLERQSARLTELRQFVQPDGSVTTLKEPRGCYFEYGHYFILDSGNARILVADAQQRIVWGWSGSLSGTPLPQILRPPRWLTVLSPRRLLVTDSVNGRVLVLRLPRWWRAGQRI